MSPRTPPTVLLAVLLLVALTNTSWGTKRVTIPDELDDVADDEEDDEWRLWGAKRDPVDKKPDPPPDLSKMDPKMLHGELMRRYKGPSFGFVKLRFGVSRSREDVPQIVTRWRKVIRTGSVDAKFTAIDLSTIMFTMERGQDFKELKEFILSQPEAYEIKIGDQVFRRPGDPPLDEVIEMKRSNNAANSEAVEKPRSKNGEVDSESVEMSRNKNNKDQAEAGKMPGSESSACDNQVSFGNQGDSNDEL